MKIFRKKEGKKEYQEKKQGQIFKVPVQNPRRIASLYTIEFSGLTSNNIMTYMEAARKGLNFYKGLLFEEIRKRDLHIGGICSTRKRAIIGREWEIKSEWEEGKNLVMDFLEKMNISNFTSAILEAELQGVSLFELNYEVVNNKIIPVSQRRIPNFLYLYDDIKDEYKILDVMGNDGYNLRMIASMASSGFDDRVDLSRLKIVDVDPIKIFEVESIDNDNSNGFRNGCIDALIWGYFLKSYGLKDYAVYLELFGNPMRIGFYDELGLNEKLRNDFVNAIKDLGNLAYAVVPNSCKIEFPSDPNKGSTSGLFKDYLNYIDNAMSIRVLGQTLTTKLGEQGSYAAAKVHEGVREDTIESDIKLIEDKINELIKLVIDLNYSNPPEIPKFEYIKEEGIDLRKKKAEMIKIIKDAGYNISKEYIENETGVKLEEESSDIELKNFIEKLINK